MKPQTANPVVLTARCTHHTASGRRCRLSVSDAHSSLCRQHRAEQLQEQSANHHLELVRNFEGFQTAQDINISLKHLYELLAQNRISPRRASVLAYINSLILRSLPQIRAAGVIDPTKPNPIAIPVPDQVIDSVAAPKLTPPQLQPRPLTWPRTRSQPRTKLQRRTPPILGIPPSPSPTPTRNPHDTCASAFTKQKPSRSRYYLQMSCSRGCVPEGGAH